VRWLMTSGMVVYDDAVGSINFHSGTNEAILVSQEIRGDRLLLEIKSPVASTSKSFLRG
jgi:hypothetical protein